MNFLVYQIVLGKTTKWLDECIENIKGYAERHGYDYQCDTEVDDNYKHMDLTRASMWMRLEKLASRPYVLYVDWDLKILKDFELNDDIITIKVIDALLYFGANVDIAKEILRVAKEKYFNNHRKGVGHFTFIDVVGDDYARYQIDDSMYKHLVWSITGKTFYKGM